MDYRKIRNPNVRIFEFCIAFIMMFCLSGCAHGLSQPKQKRAITSQFQGGSFPYYHWASPIVQEVNVPGHISNGVFIPEHKELVIIKPGEWTQSPAYPILSQEENYERTIQDVGMDVTDITHLPNGKGASSP